MALLQNGFREAPGYMFGATAVNGANVSVLEGRNHATARMRNQFVGNGITSRLASVPAGNNPPVAWLMAQKPGAMSSNYNAAMTLDAVAAILGGKALEGSATLTIDTNTPDGQLIAFGIGAVTITLSTNNPLLTASINAGGTASFEIATNTPVLGAEASIVGTTTITISVADADILPVDDLPVLRTATASMSFSGTLLPYAIGQMSGSTVDTSVLTVDVISGGVWRALADAYTDAGTMGAKLNAASAGGVDLSALAAAVWAHATRSLSGTQAAQLAEVWALHGLDPAAPLAVTPTTRTAGSIAQAITGDGTATTTVTRV